MPSRRTSRPALATAFDVIEHLDDDVAALAALGEKVGAGGHVVVTVPALPWLWSEHDNADDQHRRRYTRRTLEDSMTAAGLVVEHISYFNMLLLPMGRDRSSRGAVATWRGWR